MFRGGFFGRSLYAIRGLSSRMSAAPNTYTKKITRANPGLIVILLDGSYSMSESWGDSGSLSEGASFALNRTLRDIAQNACYSAEDGIRDYINLAVYTYGTEPNDGQGVDWTLGNTPEPGVSYIAASEWIPSALRQEKTDIGSLPIWIEPSAVGWTPMCKAFSSAARSVQQHISEYPDSFPPIVINITDGIPTDHNEDWATFARAASAITEQSTSDGNAMLFNIHIDGSGQQNSVLFPDVPVTHSTYAQQMGEISSILPANMVKRANEKLSLEISEAARGYCLNADLQQLSAFLQIGTFVPVQS